MSTRQSATKTMWEMVLGHGKGGANTVQIDNVTTIKFDGKFYTVERTFVSNAGKTRVHRQQFAGGNLTGAVWNGVLPFSFCTTVGEVKAIMREANFVSEEVLEAALPETYAARDEDQH